MISIGISRVDDHRHAVRHQVLPVLDEAVRAEPATMIAKNVIVASAAVTLKLPVAVVPPCITCLRNESSAVCSTVVRAAPSTSKIGIRPIAFAHEDEEEERQQQRRPGVHPLLADVRLRRSMSRTNSTTISSAFMKPDGTGRSCRR